MPLIFARRIRRDILDKIIVPDSTDSFNKCVSAIWKQCEGLHHSYDYETIEVKNIDIQGGNGVKQ